MMYKQGGLAHFEDGGSTSDAAPLVIQQPKKGPLAATMKTVAANPDQTQSILQQMQSLIAERESPMNIFLSGLKDAAAWGEGRDQGPTQALAVRDRQKAEEAKQLFDMRTQVAGLEAEQARQLAFQKRREQELGGMFNGAQQPAGGGGLSMPAGIRVALANARTEEDYNKIFNAWAQKQAEVSENPEMDVPKIPVVVQNPDGSFERTMVSVREYRANPNKYKDTPQTQPAVRSVIESTQPMSVRNNNPGNIKDPKTGEFMKFKTLEEGQKALDDDLRLKLSGESPAVKQRFGDVKIITPAMLAEVWSPATAQGNTPESTINYAKSIASSLGIDPTSPIPNTEQARKTVARAITEFESGQKAPPAQTPGIQIASTGPVPIPVANATVRAARPTPESLERESKIRSTYQEKMASGAAENVILDQKRFETVTEPSSVAERKTSAERVEKLITENPEAAGILAKEGITSALFTIVRDGLNTPSGAVGIKTIEDALILTMPGTSQKAINARKEVAQNLAKGALEASKLSQGQGSVSDFERSMFERIAGSLADTPELLIKRQRMLIARANLDKELGDMYRATKRPGQPLDFDSFRNSEAYIKKIEAYENNLRNILDSEIQTSKTAPKHPGAALLDKYPAQKAKP